MSSLRVLRLLNKVNPNAGLASMNSLTGPKSVNLFRVSLTSSFSTFTALRQETSRLKVNDKSEVTNPVLLRPPSAYGPGQTYVQDLHFHKPETPYERPVKGQRPLTLDRDLPDVSSSHRNRIIGFIGFAIAMTVTLAVTFNYEKTNNPVVVSTMYALRRSPQAKEALGGAIRYGSSFPWIHGELSQMRGIMDCEFYVKGNKNEGWVHFVSTRKHKYEKFLVNEWTLTTKDGVVVNLLEGDIVPMVPSNGEEPTASLNNADSVLAK